MPLVSSREMLRKAMREGYAVGAFNVENLELAQAVVNAATKMRSPVMIQTTSTTLKYAPPEVFYGMISALANQSDAPIALHLDHGSGLDLVRRCKAVGYTSLMIDGSKLSFEDNVALSRDAVALAGGVPVEAELGTVGGKEDAHEADILYTDPEKAREFVERTGIASLAIAIGTAHGVYKGVPKLNLPLLEQIHARTSIPLVLHGSSGVPEDTIRACVKEGICKVNYATDLRQTYTSVVRRWLLSNPDAFDPKSYGSAAREAVEQVVCDRMRLVGSEGKA